MDNNLAFENDIERLARVISRNHDVRVVFEGVKAHTNLDTKEICLPYFPEIDDELYNDLAGFMDIEVSRIIHADAKELKISNGEFHRQLFHAMETVRDKNAYLQDFPGAARYISRLEEKWDEMLKTGWSKLSWPVRLVHALRDRMEGREPKVDADFASQFYAAEPYIRELSKAKNTREVRVATEKITEVIIEDRANKTKTTPTKVKASMSSEAVWESSGLNSHIDSLMSKEPEIPVYGYEATWKNRAHIPVTTRFDKEIVCEQTGNREQYLELRRELMPVVRTIKGELEDVLVAREQIDWKYEQEEGALHTPALYQLIVDKNYTTPFKDFTQANTRNVAVQLLVDMSGSMYGSKIHCAKQCAMAIGEALQELQIACEITGWHSVENSKIAEFSRKLGVDSNPYYTRLGRRFNRTHEIQEYYIFKSFDCQEIDGITNIRAGLNNVDGEAVVWAARRLAARLEKRKILMVLSDGAPAAAGDNAILCSDLKKRVKEIVESGIECIGIGIESEAVKKFYPDYVVVENHHDLAKSALTKLCEYLREGAYRV